MKVVYKYKLDQRASDGLCNVRMPSNSKILTVGEQDGYIFLWAEVETKTVSITNYMFEVFSTGQEIHEDMGIDREFINTVFLFNANLVYHVYHRKN